MHGLIVNKSNVFGGQERYAALLFSGLFEQGFRLTILGGPADLLRHMPGSSVAKCINAGACHDFVVLNGNRALYESVRLPRRDEIRIYVQHSSSTDRQAGWFRPLARAVLMRLALRKVDAVIRVCDAAIPDSWVRNKPLVTVHNGIDPEQFPCKARWYDGKRPLRLLMVGAINPNKNQRLAIEALVYVSEAELTIVGEGPLRAELEVLAMERGVASRVHWAGQQSDTAVFYREADVYLMLSQFEAFPFVVIESMASGAPVVAFPVGGVPEAVTHDVDGVLLHERSPRAVAQCLRELMANTSRLESMGRQARATVERRFTVQQMVQGFLRVVELAQSRRTHGPAQ